MSYGFHPEALAEFESAADYYHECQPGLELRFIEAVHKTIARACLTLPWSNTCSPAWRRSARPGSGGNAACWTGRKDR